MMVFSVNQLLHITQSLFTTRVHVLLSIDFFLQPSPALTIRTIGGILDLFFFLTPSPAQVVQQFTEVGVARYVYCRF